MNFGWQSRTTGHRHAKVHGQAGDVSLKLTFQPLDLPISANEAHALTIYTAEPGTGDEDRLKLLANWAATPVESPSTPTNRAGQ